MIKQSTLKLNLEKHWPLTKISIDKLLQKKDKRVVYKISADEGEFVVKIANPYKTKNSIESDTSILDFLKNEKFSHSPQLLKTSNNRLYHKIEDSFVYIMEYIKGVPPKGTVEDWRQLGKITAKLHNTVGYSYQSLFNAHLKIEGLKKSQVNTSFKNEYLKVLNSLPNFNELSQSLVHTDIGPHNAIKSLNGSITLIDWDDAGTSTSILDLGFPLICQFISNDLVFARRKAKAFYNAYFSKRGLIEAEKTLIFDAAIFFALMYLPYGKIQKNWEKIKFALVNKKTISSVL